jgi:hypothetical protein
MVLARFEEENRRVYEIECSDSDSFADVSRRLCVKMSVSEPVRLIYHGHEVQPTQIFSEINYIPSSSIFIYHKGKHLASTVSTDSLEYSESESVESDDDPPDFASMVESLTDMGFSQAQARDALKLAKYDLEHAVAVILSNEGLTEILDPQSSPNNIKPFGAAFSSLTAKQKADVAGIQKLLAMDRETVLQVYDACGRVKEIAIQCLQSIQ